MTTALTEVLDERRRAEARAVRRDLFEQCRATCAEHGDDIAGYALVSWDKRGALRSALSSTGAPIAECLVPTLAGDALNRHVAVLIARRDAGVSDG